MDFQNEVLVCFYLVAMYIPYCHCCLIFASFSLLCPPLSVAAHCTLADLGLIGFYLSLEDEIFIETLPIAF